ncbi:MAG: hypothetical protein HY721_18180 [Planctomycetes bacterium]|nr:hypothetical protein [Planctomycetota bacterium]
MLRGLPELAELSASRAKADGNDAKALVLFLEDLEPEPTPAAAMAAACTGMDGRFDLTTLECAAAVRRLLDMGCGRKEVAQFFRRVGAPRRTAARARNLAVLRPEVWAAFEAGKLKLWEAEAVGRWVAAHAAGDPCGEEDVRRILVGLGDGFHRCRWTGADGARRDKTKLRRKRRSGNERRPRPDEPEPAERKRWWLTPKKRLIVRRENLSISRSPSCLRAAAADHRQLADFLEQVAGRIDEG